MKISKVLIALLILTTGYHTATSQSPAFTVKYQAVARDANDNIFPERTIGVQLSIINESGDEVYIETHQTQTTSLGHFYLELGGGIPLLGTFNTLEWAASAYSLVVAIDLDGGTQYQEIGVSPILAVPISIFSKNSEFAVIADSVINSTALSSKVIETDYGNDLELKYGSKIIQIEDTDALNEYIREIRLDECELVVVEGEKGYEFRVDLSNLKSPWARNGIGDLVYDAEGMKVNVTNDGFLISNNGDVVSIEPRGITWGFQDGSIYIDSTGTVSASLDNIYSDQIFANDLSVISNLSIENGTVDVAQIEYENGYGNTLNLDMLLSEDATIENSFKLGPDGPEQGTFDWIVESKTSRLYATWVTAQVKNFIIPNPENKNESIVYACIEGPEAAAYERGKSQLINGEAEILFSDHFRSVVNIETATFQLTPRHWDTFGLAVVEVTDSGFVVKELKGGEGSFEFDWEVKGVRKGYENFKAIRNNNDLMFQSGDQPENR